MAVIDTLSVSFVARISKFIGGLQKIGRQFGSLYKRIARVTAVVAGLTLGVAGLTGAGGLVALAVTQSQAIDTTAKLSDRLGVQTEKLSALQYAADRSGISIQSFNTGLQRVIRRSAEAAQGTGEAQQAFKDLGIDAKAFTQLPIDDKLKLLSDRLLGIDDFGKRVQVAFKLFDTEGVGFLQLLDDGADGIDKLVKRADALNLTFDRFEASKVEAANDAMTDLRGLVAGVGRTFVIEVAPFVEAFVNSLVDAGTAGDGMGRRVVSAFESITKGIAKSADSMSFLTGTWYLFQSVVQKVASVVLKGFDFIGEGIRKLLNKIPGIEIGAGGGLLKEIASRFEKESGSTFDKAIAAFDTFDKGVNSSKVANFFDKVRRRADEAAAASTRARQSVDAGLPSSPATRDPFGARAIDLETVFVGALGTSKNQEQKVRDPQIAETNKLLARIERGLGGGNVAVAG